MIGNYERDVGLVYSGLMLELQHLGYRINEKDKFAIRAKIEADLNSSLPERERFCFECGREDMRKELKRQAYQMQLHPFLRRGEALFDG